MNKKYNILNIKKYERRSKKVLSILTAFKSGKLVERLREDKWDLVKDIDPTDLANNPNYYRIRKPVPFQNAYEFINALESHGGYVIFIDKYAKLYKPLYMDNDGVAFLAFGGKEADIQKFSYEKMAKVCSFIDKTKCVAEM